MLCYVGRWGVRYSVWVRRRYGYASVDGQRAGLFGDSARFGCFVCAWEVSSGGVSAGVRTLSGGRLVPGRMGGTPYIRGIDRAWCWAFDPAAGLLASSRVWLWLRGSSMRGKMWPSCRHLIDLSTYLGLLWIITLFRGDLVDDIRV
jgi:hypothetical protein